MWRTATWPDSAPLCGRVPRRAQGGRDVPDRRVGRHGAVGRRAGAVRETSWRAVQPNRPRRIAGRRRGRGYPQRGRIAGDTDAARAPWSAAWPAQAGLRVFHEAFADRAYNADGTLVSRRLPDAVIADPGRSGGARAAHGCASMRWWQSTGTVVPLNADSVCVHGDSPSAVAMARAVRARLESEGVAIRAFAGDAAASAARD